MSQTSKSWKSVKFEDKSFHSSDFEQDPIEAEYEKLTQELDRLEGCRPSQYREQIVNFLELNNKQAYRAKAKGVG